MVVQQAIRITAILNKHLSEENCRHTVKQITPGRHWSKNEN